MTTVDKAHDLFMSFKGRSPRQIYLDACKELGVHPNSALESSLSATVDDFFSVTSLTISGNYLGKRGVLAVIPIAQCQQNLRKLELAGCGVGDDMIKVLVEVIQDHPNLRAVDLSDNPDISVYSGQRLVAAIKHNINMVELRMHRTHIGDNVHAVLARMCDENRMRMENYFKDDWFLLKDMFTGLDVDGSGWVNIKNVVGSVPYPMIREKLELRVQQTKPKKREDNSIDVNSFMLLVYTNYKTLEEIADRVEQDDTSRKNIVANWAVLLQELAAQKTVCPELHKLRIRSRVLSPEVATAIVEDAIAVQKASGAAGAAVDGAPPGFALISALSLFKGYQNEGSPSPRGRKFNSFLSTSQSRAKVWQLPPPMLKQILAFFREAPPQGLPASRVLEQSFETEFEVLQMDILRENFSRYALPLEESVLTMQEVVNMVDEQYDVLRVNKPMTVEMIQKFVKTASGGSA